MIRTASTSSTGASSYSPAHALLDTTMLLKDSIPLQTGIFHNPWQSLHVKPVATPLAGVPCSKALSIWETLTGHPQGVSLLKERDISLRGMTTAGK